MVKTRIAPSPTGAPHVATAYIALFNYAFAKKNKGKFLLRIEDTDQSRLVKGAEKQIVDALKWLGLEWDEGPFRQSERLAVYRKHAEKLVREKKAYYCFCTEARLEDIRRAAQEKGLSPRYDGFCRNLDPKKAAERAEKEKFVIRLKVPEKGKTSFDDLIRGKIEFENEMVDDQILLKSDGFPTYHLAVVVDDHLMKVSHILRGEEWISSTPKHILLYDALGWKLPKFAHFPLLRETDRSKLSKRHGSVGILEFKEEGYLPEALLNFLALLGWSHPEGKELFALSGFIENLDLNRVSTSAPVFDRAKLDWMNGEYIRELKVKSLKLKVCEYLRETRGLEIDGALVERIVPLVRERIKKLSEFEGMAGFFFKEVGWSKEMLIQKAESAGSTKEKLEGGVKALEGIESWKVATLEAELRKLAADQKWRAGKLFMILRVAISGQTVSPPLFESMEILGKEKTLRRVKKAASLL